MPLFQTRLLLRIISKSREVYFLKIITLAVAFACSTLILLFSINEFGFDRFHKDYRSLFRVIEKNNSESYNGNRRSNKVPLPVINSLKKVSADSLISSRVKELTKLNVRIGSHSFIDGKFYAADGDIIKVFSFNVVDGSLQQFANKASTAIVSSSTAIHYFGTRNAAGNDLRLFTLTDTLLFTVAAVYEDYPSNSHEEFNGFIRFDTSTIRALNFNADDAGIYGKILHGNQSYYEDKVNALNPTENFSYHFQSLSDIYFGPRVLGEDSKHGDYYSIIIIICVTVLILFLALTSFINLTTLTLPHRSKELAIKKLAGTSQTKLMIDFAKESSLIVSASLIISILVLLATAPWIKPILSLDLVSLLLKADFLLIIILLGIFVLMASAPLFMTRRFTTATPTRLLSTDTITFPKLKRAIMFLQLGVSIFLIVASMVIKRQINYSLLKEPGRNHDQIVYVSYPDDLTNEDLVRLRTTWKRINANIVDIMGTSQLPDRVSSKELNSEFYFMSVDRGFSDFFDLQMVEGNWFKVNDGDSITVVNESGKVALNGNLDNVIGVFKDINGQFNQPEKPTKINVAPYFNYNFLCIRILEVDIRETVHFLERYFERDGQKGTVSFLNRRFEEWLKYQDRLNTLSGILAIISGVLSCCAIYGLSISIVRDKLKQIAIHKLCGASTVSIVRLLVREFARQMIMAILVFGPVTYILLKEMLRTFVYTTQFTWLDPLVPIAYCLVIITLLCGFQALTLNREDLSSALKG